VEGARNEPLDALPLAKTLYLGIDAVSGKIAGGAKTREVKLCTVWSAESCDARGIPIRDEGSLSHSAPIESASRL
jgi:hypothetical protein